MISTFQIRSWQTVDPVFRSMRSYLMVTLAFLFIQRKNDFLKRLGIVTYFYFIFKGKTKYERKTLNVTPKKKEEKSSGRKIFFWKKKFGEWVLGGSQGSEVCRFFLEKKEMEQKKKKKGKKNQFLKGFKNERKAGRGWSREKKTVARRGRKHAALTA